jgi:hypothetical protein
MSCKTEGDWASFKFNVITCYAENQLDFTQFVDGYYSFA